MGTGKVLAGSGWVPCRTRAANALIAHTGWNCGRLRLHPAGVWAPENPKTKSALMSQNTHHHMWWVKAKQVQDQRCQSGPSARNSFVPCEGRFSKNYAADQQRLQISDPLFDKFPNPATFAFLEDKIQDWGMSLLTVSNGSYAVDQWSGVGWFSGWIKIFVIYSWYFNAEFWSTRCEDCFSTELNHP